MSHPTTILVIDDDADIREAVQDCLSDDGYTIVLASNGKEGLKALESGLKPQLILLDRSMPVMDAVQFLEERAKLNIAPHTPILLFTATLTETLPGVQGIISKPINLSALVERVKQLCPKA